MDSVTGSRSLLQTSILILALLIPAGAGFADDGRLEQATAKAKNGQCEEALTLLGSMSRSGSDGAAVALSASR